MQVLTDRRQINAIKILFMLTYMVSYMTRINYGAVILEIGHDTGMAGSLLSLALTGSALTYGTGQLISGYFGDKIQPKKLVFLGLCTTIVMNMLIPICQNPWQMTGIWCINGFAQSCMWPPIVCLMANLFSEEDYKKASVVVSWGSSFGTILIYLLAPVMISIVGWRSVFLVSALFGIIMLILWQMKCPHIIRESNVEDSFKQKKRNGSRAKFGARKRNADSLAFVKNPLVLGIMFAIVLQGALRDGVTTWMPSYIEETFHLGSEISILTGVVLPLFSIACYQIASAIYKKMPKDPLACAGIIFFAGSISSFLLLQFSGKNAMVCVFWMALLTGCMHGVNLILICMVPVYFKKSGNVSAVSGILNSCTYVGSAISTYGIAKISEVAGWNVTIMIWCIIAMAGSIVCFVGRKAWKNRFY